MNNYADMRAADPLSVMGFYPGDYVIDDFWERDSGEAEEAKAEEGSNAYDNPAYDK